MTISIISVGKDPKPWVSALNEIDSSIPIKVWAEQVDDDSQYNDVDFALCWKHPEGILKRFKRLKVVCSMGAGVEHILRDKTLSTHIPVVRLIDPKLSESMFEYLLTCVMMIYRDFDRYPSHQKQTTWQPFSPREKSQVTIGIMGVGKIGSDAGARLSAMGFNVSGWSNRQKHLHGIKSYFGSEQLKPFLQETHILICLLPLTVETQGVLNQAVFQLLPEGASVINVARGDHLNENDLIQALDQGHLRSAFLDVFSKEPLPSEHPFWHHEKIMITPHCSSLTDPRSVAPQIIDNYLRMKKGEALLNQVDVVRGY